ncbi:MAG TPA: hypothetical protein PKM88_04695 [bacterium]|nr:hypothetical protein [bacterium]
MTIPSRPTWLLLALALTVACTALVSYIDVRLTPLPPPSPAYRVLRAIPAGADISRLYWYSHGWEGMAGTDTRVRCILDATTELDLATGTDSAGWTVVIETIPEKRLRVTGHEQAFAFAFCPPDTRMVPLLIARLAEAEAGRASAALCSIGEPARPQLERAVAGAPPAPARDPGACFRDIPADTPAACRYVLAELDRRRQAGVRTDTVDVAR